MGGYFWAGLLAGLLIWVLAEVASRLRRPVSRKLLETVFAVVEAEEPGEDLEYCLRRLRADLSGSGFSRCQVLLLDKNLDEEAKAVASRIGGVRICSEKELSALVLPEQMKEIL